MQAVIVQARLGSTRLRGKVLERLNGQTVLAEVLERCHAIAGADVVCCAVPDTEENDPVAAAAAEAGAAVFRGAEHDVLDRYHRAARHLGADVVMRVTSDCPLIDPDVCAAVLSLVGEQRYDYGCNNLPPSWPHGLDCEAMTMAWLARAADRATAPADREHVTPFIRAHPEARRANVLGPGEPIMLQRWTLDTSDDLAFLRELWQELPNGPRGWSYRVPQAVVEAHPELAALGRYATLSSRFAPMLRTDPDQDVAQYRFVHDSSDGKLIEPVVTNGPGLILDDGR